MSANEKGTKQEGKMTKSVIRIEKVNVEARESGWSGGWHLFVAGEYANTFATRQEAREAAKRLVSQRPRPLRRSDAETFVAAP